MISIMKSVFRQYRRMCCTYELLRRLDLQIWWSLCWWQTKSITLSLEGVTTGSISTEASKLADLQKPWFKSYIWCRDLVQYMSLVTCSIFTLMLLASSTRYHFLTWISAARLSFTYFSALSRSSVRVSMKVAYLSFLLCSYTVHRISFNTSSEIQRYLQHVAFYLACTHA